MTKLFCDACGSPLELVVSTYSCSTKVHDTDLDFTLSQRGFISHEPLDLCAVCFGTALLSVADQIKERYGSGQ